MNRRKFITHATLAVSGLSINHLSVFGNSAQAAERVSSEDSMAVSLKYVNNAVDSSVRTNKNSSCVNCQFYSGATDSNWGPCSLFSGKEVNAKGWCTAWSSK